MSRNTLIVSPKCDGSGASIYEWAGSEKPDANGRAACPVCSKRVLLEKHGVMPRHNRAIGRRLVPNHIAAKGGDHA